MKLTHVPLEKLKVSATNMRHGGKRPDIADITALDPRARRAAALAGSPERQGL